MYSRNIICFVVLGFVVSCLSVSDAKVAPDFIRPCNNTSRECLMKFIQDTIPEFVKGIPSLGLEVLDPFVIEKLSMPLIGLNVTLYQAKITGFRTCIVDNIIPELEKKHFELEFHCNLTITGRYEAVGTVLLFPINGGGDAVVKLTNLRAKVDMTTTYYKDTKDLYHVGLKDYKYTFEYGDKVTFDLQNLVKESKELSAVVLAFLNLNWRTVVEIFGKPIVDYGVDLALRTMDKFFVAVPYAELLNVPIPE